MWLVTFSRFCRFLQSLWGIMPSRICVGVGSCLHVHLFSVCKPSYLDMCYTDQTWTIMLNRFGVFSQFEAVVLYLEMPLSSGTCSHYSVHQLWRKHTAIAGVFFTNVSLPRIFLGGGVTCQHVSEKKLHTVSPERSVGKHLWSKLQHCWIFRLDSSFISSFAFV